MLTHNSRRNYYGALNDVPYTKMEDQEEQKSQKKSLSPAKDPTDISIAIKDSDEEKVDAIIDTHQLRKNPPDYKIYHPESTQIKFGGTEKILSELKQQADEAINLFREFHWTPEFVLSLIATLGLTGGALALSIIENRWDEPFFAAEAAGMTMLILAGIGVASIALSCCCRMEPFFPCATIALMISLMTLLQLTIDSYYTRSIEPSTPIDPNSPAGYAEGAGILGLLAIIASIPTYVFYIDAFKRTSLFSEEEERILSLAQDSIFSNDKDEGEHKDHKSALIVRGNDPKNYFRAKVPDKLKEAKNQISKNLQNLRSYKARALRFFPPDDVLPQPLKKLILDYAYQPRWRPKHSRG